MNKLHRRLLALIGWAKINKTFFWKIMIKNLLLFALISTPVHYAKAQMNSFIVKAKEGFESKNPEKKFASAWRNTFMYAVTEKNAYDFSIEKMGTVSVAFKKETHDGAYIGLITAKHVVLDHENKNGRFFKNIQYDTMINVGEAVDELNVLEMSKSYVSPTHDLGLLVVKVSTSTARSLTPLTFTEKCSYGEGSPVVIIGFPAVMTRHASDQNVPIKSPTVITKRWSEGRYVEDYTSNKYGPLVGTTADAMTGNSGGPVVDTQGNLMGVQAAVKYQGLKYHGAERRKSLVGHSWIVDCQETKDFARESWNDFIQSAPIAL